MSPNTYYVIAGILALWYFWPSLRGRLPQPGPFMPLPAQPAIPTPKRASVEERALWLAGIRQFLADTGSTPEQVAQLCDPLAPLILREDVRS